MVDKPYRGCDTTYQVVGSRQHPSGFTQYKIVVTTVKVNPTQDFLQERFVWKRYSDVSNLYRTLLSLHRSLYLPGKFPAFVKPKIFGRFDEAVIKERSRCVQDLLDFACQYKPLHLSKAIVEFFKESQPLESSRELSSDDHLKPMNARQVSTSMTSSKSSTRNFPTLQTDNQQEQRSSSTAILEFDPINQCQEVSVEKVRDDWLAVLNNAVLEPQQPPPSTSTTAAADNLAHHNSSGKIQEKAEEEAMLREQHRRLSKARAYLQHVQQKTTADDQQQNHRIDTTASILLTTTPTTASNNHARSKPRNSFSQSPGNNKSGGKTAGLAGDLKKLFVADELEEDKGAYLVKAGHHISAAQQAYCSCDYQTAVDRYQSAVQVLIKGVQGDTDEARVEAVRRKTAKYLKKAEDLNRKYLMRKTASDEDGDDETKHETTNHISKYPTDMSSYKVIGVVGKVMIAIDSSSERTCAIKVHRKLVSHHHHHHRQHYHRSSRATVVPTNVPYMVRLYKYFTTDSAVVLVLEYITGGRLWERKEGFMERVEEENNKEEEKEEKTDETKQDESHNTTLHSTPNKNSSSTIDDVIDASRDRCEDNDDVMFTIDSVSTVDDEEENHVTGASHVIVNSDASGEELSSCGENQDSSDDDEEDEGGSSERRCELLSEQDLSQQIESPLPPPATDDVSSDDDDDDDVTNDDVISEVDATVVLRRQRSCTRSKSQLSCSSAVDDDRPDCGSHVDHQFVDGDRAPDRCQIEQQEVGDYQQQDVKSLLKLMSKKHQYRLPEHVIRSWAVEMVIAIGTLHSIGILCRDFNPNNLLLTEDGHIRLTYFGKWRHVDGSVRSNSDLSGDDEHLPPARHYLAPEINKIHHRLSEACDWWSVGAVLFELFCGKSLHSCHPCGITTHTQLNLPAHLSPEAASLLSSLLTFHPDQRLGYGPNGLDHLMSHPFFASVDWDTRIEFCHV